MAAVRIKIGSYRVKCCSSSRNDASRWKNSTTSLARAASIRRIPVNRTFAVCRDSRIRFEHDPESNLINRREYQCALQLRRPHVMKRLLRQPGNWQGFGCVHAAYSGPAIWVYFRSNSAKWTTLCQLELTQS